MLALSRKEGQTIVIDQDIRVTVLSIKGNRITLGIDAPSIIPVRREEISRALAASFNTNPPPLPLASALPALG